jgi:hypothetical protein
MSVLFRLLFILAQTKVGQTVLIELYKRYVSTEMRQNVPYNRPSSRKDYR